MAQSYEIADEGVLLERIGKKRSIGVNRNEEVMPLTELKSKPVYEFCKRVVDILGSLTGLVCLSWLILGCALAVFIEDGGNPFFVQERVGKNGKLFKMYKLRSMVIGADKIQDELEQRNEADGPVFKIKEDPRVTKVGKFIRATSIDELCQLVNILRGDMSIVGPRPPLPEEVAQYNDYAMQRLLVKPGLTCYWQCSGRSDICFDEWMRLDVQYIHDRGFWKDIELILRTIPAVLKRDGAC